MSGPKSDTIELQRRQQLYEALEARTKKYNEACRNVRSAINEAENYKNCFLNSCNDLLGFESKEASIIDIQQRLRNSYDAMLNCCEESTRIQIVAMDSSPSFSHECAEAVRMNTIANEFMNDITRKRVEFLRDRELCKLRIEYFSVKARAIEELKSLLLQIKEIYEASKETSFLESISEKLEDDISQVNELISLIENEVQNESFEIKQQTDSIINKSFALVKRLQTNILHYNEFVGVYKRGKDSIDAVEKIMHSINEFVADGENNVFLNDIIFEEWKELSFMEKLENKAKQKLEKLLDSMEALTDNEYLSDKNHETICRYYNDLMNAAKNNFGNVIVNINQYEIIVNNIRKETELFEKGYMEYFACCSLLQEMVGNNIFAPLEKEQFDSLEALDDELQLIKKKLEEENKILYIRQTIDDVMKQFGFNTTDEIFFRKNAVGTHLISQKTSSDVGLHIYLGGNDNDRIMMEVVGTSKSSLAATEDCDAKFVPNNLLTNNRKEQLLEEQRSFCSMHKEITAELENRGILMNVIEHNEPSLEFCREINILTKTEAMQKNAMAIQKRTKRQKPNEMALRKKQKAFIN